MRVLSEPDPATETEGVASRSDDESEHPLLAPLEQAKRQVEADESVEDCWRRGGRRRRQAVRSLSFGEKESQGNPPKPTTAKASEGM